MKITRYLLMAAAFFAVPFTAALAPSAPALDAPPHPRLIAHAGGGINGWRYTNSLEALSASYANGFRFFEIDFEETADGRIVLLHDWDYSIEHFYNAKPKQYSLAEFKQLRLRTGLTQLTLSELAVWLIEHPDAFIIPDFKRQPVRFLKRISQGFPSLRSRLIPQIYSLGEYRKILKFGFLPPILTLYTSSYSDKKIITFATTHNLWAVTMSVDRAERSDLASQLRQRGIVTYSHLVDDTKTFGRLAERGIHGVYTAFLKP